MHRPAFRTVNQHPINDTPTMKTNSTRQLWKLSSALALSLAAILGAAAAAGAPASVQTVNVVQTNWTPRYITNLIEVSAPQNVFVTEYRTNWTQRTVTNVVEVALTNWSTRTLTNTTALTLFRTNFVDRYATNWSVVAMTNWNTLTLTNWETVVITKTNWIRQPMLNVVEVNVPVAEAFLPATTPPAAPPTAPAAAPVTAPVPAAAPAAVLAEAVSAGDVLVVDVVRLITTAADNRRELKFTVRLAADAAVPLQVEQWRVERDDAAVLFYAQTQEFKRALPPGRYSVQVSARRDAASPLLTLRRALEVTGDSVVQR